MSTTIMLHSGFTHLAKMFAGKAGCPNGMYVEYCNNDTCTIPQLKLNMQRSRFDSLDAGYGYARVTSLTCCSFKESGLSNTVTASCIVKPTDAVYPKVTPLTPGTSKIVAAYLVYISDINDRTKDILVCAASFDTALEVALNTDVAVTMGTDFNNKSLPVLSAVVSGTGAAQTIKAVCTNLNNTSDWVYVVDGGSESTSYTEGAELVVSDHVSFEFSATYSGLVGTVSKTTGSEE